MKKTSQELRMLSSVTINCQVTKIVMNSGSQLSQVFRIALKRCSQNVFVFVFVSVFVFVFVNFFGHVMSSHHSEQMSQKGHKSLGSLCNVKSKSDSVSQSVSE